MGTFKLTKDHYSCLINLSRAKIESDGLMWVDLEDVSYDLYNELANVSFVKRYFPSKMKAGLIFSLTESGVQLCKETIIPFTMIDYMIPGESEVDYGVGGVMFSLKYGDLNVAIEELIDDYADDQVIAQIKCVRMSIWDFVNLPER